MKFKGTFSERGIKSLEKGFLPTLEKFGKSVALLLGPEDVHLIQTSAETDGPMTTARLAVDVLFEPGMYTLCSRHHNLIALRCEANLLQRVLRSASSNLADDCLEVKLASRSVDRSVGGGTGNGTGLGGRQQAGGVDATVQKPFLSFTGRGANLNMVQDMPISDPLRPAEVDQLRVAQEVDLAPFYIDAGPEAATLQALAERLKAVSGTLRLQLLRTGDLHLQVKETGLEFGAEFRQLDVFPSEMALPPDTLRETTAAGRLAESTRAAGQSAGATLHSRHLSRALAAAQVTMPAKILVGVAEGSAYVHVMMVYRDPMQAGGGTDENINLSFVLPVVMEDD